VPADRTKLIRAIHASARKLGLDDEARRDVQVGATKKASLTDMDASELRLVLDRLNRDSRTSADRPHIGKVRALWCSLYWLGAVDQSDPKAIDSFVRRQTGVAGLRMLDHRQAHSVVDALKLWLGREGVKWPKQGNPLLDRRAVFDEIRMRLPDEPIPGLPVAPQHGWTAAEWDAAIRVVGKRFRQALEQ